MVSGSRALPPRWPPTRHNFGRGPSNDYFIKVWFQLSNWFQSIRFLCEFPIGSYVKLSSAVGAILVEGPNRRTHFWKRTIQWLFHQKFVLIEQMVSDKKIFMGISHRADFPKLAEKLSVIRTDRHEDLVRPKHILPVRKKSPKIFTVNLHNV
jgi:hypothetical protein